MTTDCSYCPHFLPVPKTLAEVEIVCPDLEGPLPSSLFVRAACAPPGRLPLPHDLGDLPVDAAVAEDGADAARRAAVPAAPLQRRVHEAPAQPVPLDRRQVGRRRRREQPTQVPARAEKMQNYCALQYGNYGMG